MINSAPCSDGMCGALDCPRCGPLQGSRECKDHDRLACPDCEGKADRAQDLLDELERWRVRAGGLIDVGRVKLNVEETIEALGDLIDCWED